MNANSAPREMERDCTNNIWTVSDDGTVPIIVGHHVYRVRDRTKRLCIIGTLDLGERGKDSCILDLSVLLAGPVQSTSEFFLQ